MRYTQKKGRASKVNAGTQNCLLRYQQAAAFRLRHFVENMLRKMVICFVLHAGANPNNKQSWWHAHALLDLWTMTLREWHRFRSLSLVRQEWRAAEQVSAFLHIGAATQKFDICRSKYWAFSAILFPLFRTLLPAFRWRKDGHLSVVYMDVIRLVKYTKRKHRRNANVQMCICVSVALPLNPRRSCIIEA